MISSSSVPPTTRSNRSLVVHAGPLHPDYLDQTAPDDLAAVKAWIG